MSTKYTVEFVSKFNLLDFVNRQEDYNWMRNFYNICDNAEIYYKALIKEGYDGFNFDIYEYEKISKNIKEKNKFYYNIDDHLEDLRDIIALQYQHIWAEYNDPYRVKYPNNMINYILYDSEIPNSIDCVINNIRMSLNIKDTEIAVEKCLDILLDKERDGLLWKYKDHKSMIQMLDLYQDKYSISNIDAIYNILKRAKYKIRKDYKSAYLKYGYLKTILDKAEKEKLYEEYKRKKYLEAKKFLDMINTPIKDAEHLVQSKADQAIIDIFVENTSFKTIRDLYCTTLPDIKEEIKNVKGLGDRKLSHLMKNLRRYYNIIPPKDRWQVHANESHISIITNTVKQYEEKNDPSILKE